MGQVFVPAIKDIILTSVDRLIARNADGGLSPNAAHIVLFGENAGQNLGDVDHVYVIGSDSLKGGLINAAQEGSVIYGANNLQALTNSVAPLIDGPIVAIGFNIAPLMTRRVSTDIIIGAEIAKEAPALAADFDASIVMGYQAIEHQRTLAANGGQICRRSVVLGYRAFRGTAFTVDGAGSSLNESVIIGAEALENAGFDAAAPGTAIEGTIAIGRRALRQIANGNGLASSFNVAIGYQVATTLRSGQRNVFIGNDITTPATDCLDDVLIGGGIVAAHTNNTGQNLVLGAIANIQGLGARNIILGSGANSGALLVAASSDNFLVESVNSSSGVRRNLMYGNMGTLTGAVVTACGLALGLSSAANRDLPGMNIVKLINGNRDAGLTAPVGGGYFYSSGGELHWVSTGNFDYALTGAGQIFTVATLPAAAPAGTRAFVTDALAPAFGAAVAGGGAVFTTVFRDNAATWIVG